MFAETSTIEDCLESDVHHMMSQILLILNDFIQDFDKTRLIQDNNYHFLVVFQIFRS